ncbi:hypothetical protein BCR42DRAFT_411326 [Absidia repens]|uniref:SH3 domain-containing protein n=1 Tax=Absidia repens TaxID=90262 RepID=A0A1X2ILK5_9FUNG|nr:hypothetical protein BCR42DRAFT_411326 [Absidia repens]
MLNAIALYDCVADEEGELSFTEGTRFVDVVDSTEEDWLEGRIEGTSQRGLFPSNYVNVITVSSTPTVVKPIRKAPNSDASLSQSVSPPNSNISSSWSVISNTPTTTTPTTTDINSSDTSTSKSTRLNAFESAMQTPSSSKYSDIAATLMNKRTMPKPTMVSTSSNATTNSNTSTSIAATNDNNKSSSTARTFVLPTLSPVQQQARARSFSASSTTTPAPPTSLKPSALRQDLRKTAQLDTSWRTKLDNGSSPTTVTNTIQHPLLNPPTDNKVNIIGTHGNDDEDMEEEDGYQLIKPSQLRKQQQRQQQGKDFGKLNTSTTLPLSSSVSTSALPSQKSSASSKTRLQTLPSSSTTHLAKLPSRPVSNANRQSKSRSSSTRTNSASQVKSIDSTTPTPTDSSRSNTNKTNNSTAIVAASNKTAPSLKPKPPQLNNLPKTSVMITKERSASNPPPIQPKSFSNDIQRPSKPIVESKPLFPLATTQAEKKGTTTKTPPLPPLGARGGVALPGLGKKNSAPILPTRPSAATNKPISSSSGSAIDDIFKDKQHLDENTNLKPSQLLTTQRARSSTNPSFATRPLIDITNGNGSGSRNLSSTALDTPIDGAIRSPPPPPAAAATTTTTTSTKSSSSSPAIPLIIKQAPPPPPPSRQVNNNSNKKESGAHTRYDGLFDTIQDDGYVDGLTTQVIWGKSRLPYDILAGIWQQCDQQKSGLLDRQRFIHGMQLIDSHLAKNRTSTTS